MKLSSKRQVLSVGQRIQVSDKGEDWEQAVVTEVSDEKNWKAMPDGWSADAYFDEWRPLKEDSIPALGRKLSEKEEARPKVGQRVEVRDLEWEEEDGWEQGVVTESDADGWKVQIDGWATAQCFDRWRPVAEKSRKGSRKGSAQIKGGDLAKALRRGSVSLSETSMEGYLEKKATTLTSSQKYQSRYFVLRGHYLQYYKDKQSASAQDPKGMFDIKTMKVISLHQPSFFAELK